MVLDGINWFQSNLLFIMLKLVWMFDIIKMWSVAPFFNGSLKIWKHLCFYFLDSYLRFFDNSEFVVSNSHIYVALLGICNLSLDIVM